MLRTSESYTPLETETRFSRETASELRFVDAVRAHHRKERGVDSRGARQYVPSRPPALAAVEIGDEPAGLADQDRSRRGVPGREAELEEAVEDAGGRVGEVERGASRAPDGANVE